MGGVINRGTYAVPWTGGKPNKFWTGLENANTVPKPNQMRAMDHKSAYSYNLREAGLYSTDEEKFKKGGKITSFVRDLHAFYLTHGMDAILYRHDPMSTDANPPLINIMTEYARLNLYDMESQHNWFFQHYDDYDLNNSTQATKFLLNSLETDTKDIILEKVGNNPQDFGVVLLTLLEDVHPFTTQAVQNMIDAILQANPPVFQEEKVLRTPLRFPNTKNQSFIPTSKQVSSPALSSPASVDSDSPSQAESPSSVRFRPSYHSDCTWI
jgi:hypothetical protein